MTPTARHLTAACLLAIFASPRFLVAQSPPAWRRVIPGLEVASAQVPHRAPSPISTVRLTALRADPNLIRVRVIDVGAASESAGVVARQQLSRYGIASLRSLQSSLPRAVAAINGGFVTSYAFPRPVGLAVVNHKEIGRLSEAVLLSGVLCVGDKARIDILPARVYADSGKPQTPGGGQPMCLDALQAGPLLVERPGRNGITSSEPSDRVHTRSGVCVDDSGRVLLLYASATSLFDLAAALRVPEEKGGFGCAVALNLSGDSDAGLMWREGKQFESVGSLDASLATALVLEVR